MSDPIYEIQQYQQGERTLTRLRALGTGEEKFVGVAKVTRGKQTIAVVQFSIVGAGSIEEAFDSYDTAAEKARQKAEREINKPHIVTGFMGEGKTVFGERVIHGL